MKKNIFVQICPKCGSTNVKSYYLMSPAELTRPGAKKLQERFKAHPIGSVAIGWQPQNPSVFVCKDCDYNGICPEIEVTQIEKFRKKLKKSEGLQASYYHPQNSKSYKSFLKSTEVCTNPK